MKKFEICQELRDLIKDMNVPTQRMDDPLWLARNLPINNKGNPKLGAAMKLVHKEWERRLNEMRL